MIYALAKALVPAFTPLNAITYITTRAALSALTAFLLCLLCMPRMIAMLRAFKAGAPLRDAKFFVLHDRHEAKEGTPTMGGLLIIAAILAAALLWGDLTAPVLWVLVLMLAGLGAVGFVDDYLKLKRRQGLRAKQKLAAQIVLGLLLGVYLHWNPVAPAVASELELPFIKNVYLPLGMLYIPFAMLVTVGSSNAVNITDGLDGLAVGALVIAAAAYTGMAYLCGRVDFAQYLYITYVPTAGELTIFSAAMVGAGLGFLWFNAHPAQIFMGDAGSLALGGALGTMALLIKQELLLVVVGGLFVLEALSVMIQVGSYKLRGGKRVFRMAPLHHHCELLGWSETQVTIRFWIIAILCGFAALATLKLR